MQFITGPKLSTVSKVERSNASLPSDVVAVYPMTRSQEGLWIAYCMAPQHTLYNLTLKFTFLNNSETDYDSSLEAIQRGLSSSTCAYLHGILMPPAAIVTLTSRHAILRSTFHNADGMQLRPFVAEHDANSAMPILHIVSQPQTNTVGAKAQALSLLRAGADLSSGFAVRWIAIIGTEKTELYVVAHHIALDGTSMSHLSTELFGLLGHPLEASVSNGAIDKEKWTTTKTTLDVATKTPFCQAHMFEVRVS